MVADMYAGVISSVRSVVTPTQPVAALPVFLGENESFYDEGDSTAGWTTDFGSLSLTSAASKLILSGASAAVKKTISAPSTGDFITYFKIKGSQNAGDYWGVYFMQAGTYLGVIHFGYNWVTGAAANGVISIYAQSGAQKKIIKTGADCTQYQEIALWYDTDRSALNIYIKDAFDKWQFATSLAAFADFRSMNTVKLAIDSASPITIECDYILSAKPNVLAIGDSLCAGANHFDPDPITYAGDDDNATTWMRHAHIYRDKRNSLIINKGVGSQSSSQLLSRISEATAHNPKVVFVHASSNDYSLGVTQALRTSNMQSIINSIAAIGADAVLLNAAYPNSNHPSGAAITAYDLDWWTNYRPALTGAAVSLDIMQPILLSGSMNPSLTEGDGIHPTAAGYQAIGEYINGFE